MKVEFHCHSIYSGDSLAKPDKLFSKAMKLGLEKVAVTDHNTIQGGLELAMIAPEMAIIGEEIRVRRNGLYLGEVIGYFLKEEIPADLEVEDVMGRLKEQEAFIHIPHPFDVRRSQWTEELLLTYAEDIDSIEVFNSRSMTKNSNQEASLFVQKHNWLGLNGSDAHSCYELGRSFTELPEFNNAETMRKALSEAKLHNRISCSGVHLLSRLAVIQNRLSSKA